MKLMYIIIETILYKNVLDRGIVSGNFSLFDSQPENNIGCFVLNRNENLSFQKLNDTVP